MPTRTEHITSHNTCLTRQEIFVHGTRGPTIWKTTQIHSPIVIRIIQQQELYAIDF